MVGQFTSPLPAVVGTAGLSGSSFPHISGEINGYLDR